MQKFSPAALKAARQHKGYTQKELGIAVGTTERHVQSWEYGTRSPTATYLLRLMVLLDCSATDLLTDGSTE
jgi:transcriptional regulator with XRE-family HTH domain